MEPRVSCLLGSHLPTELHPQHKLYKERSSYLSFRKSLQKPLKDALKPAFQECTSAEVASSLGQWPRNPPQNVIITPPSKKTHVTCEEACWLFGLWLHKRLFLLNNQSTAASPLSLPKNCPAMHRAGSRSELMSPGLPVSLLQNKAFSFCRYPAPSYLASLQIGQQACARYQH